MTKTTPTSRSRLSIVVCCLERPTIAASLLFVLALTLRLAAVTTLDIEPIGDYLAYHTMAVNLLTGEGVKDIFGNFAYYNPGYSIFVLAPVYKMFGFEPAAAQITNALLGAISTVLIHLLAREIIRNPSWSLLAGFLFATDMESIAYCEYLAKENLIVPVTLSSLLAVVSVRKHHRHFAIFLLSGTLLGIALLTATSTIYLFPALVLIAYARVRHDRKTVTAMIALLAGCAIVVSPWIVRNEIVLGAPVFSTSAGFNLYLGNNPNATGRFVSISETPMAAQWQILRDRGEVVADKELRRAAIDYVENNPKEALRLALRKVALLWIPPVHHLDVAHFSTGETISRLIWLAQYTLIAAGALLFVPYMLKKWKKLSIEIKALGLMVVIFTFIHAAVYVILRYRVPIMPQMIILFCFGLNQTFAPKFRAA